MPFADITAVNSVVRQTLAYGFYIISHGYTVRHLPIGMRKGSGKYGGPGRAADRLARIGILVPDAFGGQPVQIWCDHFRISIAAQHVFARGVCHYKDDLFFHMLFSGFYYLQLIF